VGADGVLVVRNSPLDDGTGMGSTVDGCYLSCILLVCHAGSASSLLFQVG